MNWNVELRPQHLTTTGTQGNHLQIPWSYSVKWLELEHPGLPGLLELYVELSESVIKKRWKILHASSLLDLSWNTPWNTPCLVCMESSRTYKNVNKLESIQRQAARFVLDDYRSESQCDRYAFIPAKPTPPLVSVRCSTKSIILHVNITVPSEL